MKHVYILLTLLFVLIISPVIIWQFIPSKELDIAIINKTVSDNDMREHLGITWFFNHYKYGKQLDEHTDYFGTHYKDGQLIETGLPDSLSKYDFIYLADSYGVYADDLDKTKRRLGARTEKIYGGLEDDEWDKIVARLSQENKSLFVSEFNSYASPTSQEVKQKAFDFLHVDWDGWVGRYFDELDYRENIEIPQWVVDEFGEDWPYKGEGFLFANDYTYEVVVLELDKHINSNGIKLKYTDEGKDLFNLKDSPNYRYWFDVITPKSGTDVLAYYDWDLTKEGKELLAEHGIPEQFAGVVRNEKRTSISYYFAGDFNDVASAPYFHEIFGLASINRLAYSFGDSAFFWNSYMPMMKKIMKHFEQFEVQPLRSEEIVQTARINDQTYEIFVDGQWEPITIKGVNIGMGKPGAFPGEAAITYDEYYRWFEDIGKMNSNTIRVYTLHPPDFYDALADYNAQAEKPLYVIHGAWIGEEPLVETLDAYTPEILEEFQQEMKTISDVIHGNAYVSPRPGHASGTYNSNISSYVIGWIIGIEWYPLLVENMVETLYPDKPDYNGRFFETKNANAFEIWLAEQMDYLFSYEFDTYHSIRPMAASNWVTTDLLTHPYEPDVKEDMATVDPNNIYTKAEAKLSEQFASYHVYPYYPDFMNNEPELLNFIDHRGEKNTYAGYLRRLHEAHRIPILISEFGIPNARGLTHLHAYGMDQGFKSEQEQGEMLIRLYEDILEEDMLGGLVFIWQDEWFKRTWNTFDYDNPDRRPFWSNVQTNEQRFGLIAFETNKVLIDGEDDWQAKPIADNLTVDSDETYLYVKVDTNADTERVKILLDTVPNQGLMTDETLVTSNALEFVVNVDRNEEQSRLLTSPLYHLYNYVSGYYNPNNWAEQPKPDETKFDKTMYILNRRLEFPIANKSNPPEVYETGKLKFGNGNPEADDYNSLTDYHWTPTMLEIRIPWLLIQAKDPSKREFIGDLQKDGYEASVTVDNIYIGAVQYNKENAVVSSSVPFVDNVLSPLTPYTWQTWEQPPHSERLKKSYYMLQDFFKTIN